MDDVIVKTATYEGRCSKDGTGFSGTCIGATNPNNLYLDCPYSFYTNPHKILLTRITPPICKHPNKTFDQGSMTGTCPDCGERWAE